MFKGCSSHNKNIYNTATSGPGRWLFLHQELLEWSYEINMQGRLQNANTKYVLLVAAEKTVLYSFIINTNVSLWNNQQLVAKYVSGNCHYQRQDKQSMI